MKFKNDKNWKGTHDANRFLKIKDKDGTRLQIDVYDTGKPAVMIEVDGWGIGMTRAKAIKLAEAILDELDPVC